MTRIVSVTPLALERDSRTFKHAASLARLGYESVVVEGERSTTLPGPLPFTLVTPPEPAGRDIPSAEADDSEPAEADLRAAAAPGGGPPSRLAGLAQRAATPLRRERARWSAASRFLRDYGRINRRTLAALPEADLYWLHSYWQFPGVYMKCRRSGGGFAYDAHDSYRDLPPIPLPLVPATLALIERACAKRAAALSTVSDGVAERLRRRFAREVAVIRNANDARLDRSSGAELRGALGLTANDFLVVMVGQNKHGIALDEASAALSRLEPGIHLAFVGAGFEREGTNVPAGRSRIHFVAPVGPTEVADFIASADAATLLYKPLTENLVNALPNGFFQAVAARLPLLHPPLPEVRRLSEQFDLGPPIDPSDPESIASAIGGLLADPSRLAEFKANAQRARDELTWEREEPKLARMAEAALGTPRSGSGR